MKSRIVAIAIALLVALVGAILVINYAHKADDRAVAGQRVKDVYIAVKAVPQGTPAKSAADQGLISLEKVVAKGVPAGALTQLPESATTQVALSTIAAGSMVLADRFGDASEIQTSSGVPAGKVAISVGLSDTAAIKPFLDKGSHIALYDTFNRRTPTGALAPYGAHLNDDKGTVRATGVVLPDVEVIGLNIPKSAAGGGASSSVAGGSLLVTVAVAPADATRLIHAIQTGNLYAALLGSGAKVAPGATASDNHVVGG